MGDSQCGLCLSCGVPFFPDLTEVQSFNRQGVQSLVFLNIEYKDNRDVRALYSTPRFSSERHEAHVFHRSHHATAIDFMCRRYRGDMDVGPAAPAGNAVIVARPPAAHNPAFLYFHAPTSQNGRGPHAATWLRPPANHRIRLPALWNSVIHAANDAEALPIHQNLEMTFLTCDGCNYLMTQLADMRYILGYRASGARNTHGPVIGGQPLRQYRVVQNGHDLDNAYGNWAFPAAPAHTLAPALDAGDSDSPHVAYYLHMCMPFTQVAGGRDVFRQRIVNPVMRRSARMLYIEQCWLLLEIAAMATIVEEGKVTENNARLSHGMQQHYGVLDLYASFFMFRLLQFRFGRRLRATGVDFVQWHQKYYSDALRCRTLFPRGSRGVVIAQSLYGTTSQPSRGLIQQIARRLVALLGTRLADLVRVIIGAQGVPRSVSAYFVPVEALVVLRGWSRSLVRSDFHAALGRFGAGALLYRITDLCVNCPASFVDQLNDFRACWQRLEVEQVRANNRALTGVAAFQLYYMSVLLFAPAEIPSSKAGFFALIQSASFASHWNSVLALEHIGAFKGRPVP